MLNYRAPNQLDDLRYDGVAEAPKSVHPSGNPMSHSTHVGFSLPPTTSDNGMEFFASVASEALPLFQSRAIGVGTIAGTLPCLSRTSRRAIALASSSVA